MKKITNETWQNTFPTFHGRYGEPYTLGCRCKPCVKANTQKMDDYELMFLTMGGIILGIGAMVGIAIGVVATKLLS